MAIASYADRELRWAHALEEVKQRLGTLFGRIEPRRAAFSFLDGLLSGVERKTGWQLAERLGDPGPWRIQAVLGRGDWDADAARDLVRTYVIEKLGADDGVLVIDETGFVKKGNHSVGVARQYSGTAGRIENSQIGVFLGYANRHGQALIDRRLYLPQEWASDATRREQACVPDDITFATKPRIACELLTAALNAGVPCAWVLADAVYGSDKNLRMMLERRGKHYVLAVRSNERLMADDRFLHHARGTAADLAAALPAAAWERHSAGQGAKGPRVYDWARIRLLRLQHPPREHWLLVRRSRKDKTDCAYYVVFAPVEASLAELARVAGRRWTIEECFQSAKGEVGLDHCEARSWHGWNRHVTLAMLALAYLAALRANAGSIAQGKRNKRSPASLATQHSSRSLSRKSAH
jgi:SRSO17 transposase